MKILAITQARMSSSRLPEKIFKEIKGEKIIDIHLNRVKKSTKITHLILATSTNKADDLLLEHVKQNHIIDVFRGSESNVLERFYLAAINHQPDYVVRLTSDCPLIDPQLIDNVIEFTILNKLDYCSNTLIPMFPDGQDIEVFTFKALEKAYNEANLESEKEHVTPYIWKNSTFKQGVKFKSNNFLNSFGDYSKVRMTLDEQNDFDLLNEIISQLGTDKTWKEYSDYIIKNTSIFDLNKHIKRNEGLNKSLQNDNNN